MTSAAALLEVAVKTSLQSTLGSVGSTLQSTLSGVGYSSFTGNSTHYPTLRGVGQVAVGDRRIFWRGASTD